MKYLNKFDSLTKWDLFEMQNHTLSSHIGLINKKVKYPLNLNPFYVEAIDNISISSKYKLDYSFDGINWSIGGSISVPSGVKVYLKPRQKVNEDNSFDVSGKYNIGGLLDLSASDYHWSKDCFAGETGLISAKDLVIVGSFTYGYSHSGGSNAGYKGLFENCTNLVSGPKWINAANFMYRTFRNCTSLKESPVIQFGIKNSTTIGMSDIFFNCPNLSRITVLDDGKGQANTTNFISHGIETGDTPLTLILNWNGRSSANQYFINIVPENSTIIYYYLPELTYHVKFKIGTVSYDVPEGTKWSNWSKMNSKGYSIVDGKVMKGDLVVALDGIPVNSTDEIKCLKGHDYQLITLQSEESENQEE